MTDIPQIEVKYTLFPEGYVNDVRGWGFDADAVKRYSGQLLTLDIDFGSRCSLNCPFCFRKENSVDQNRHTLKFEDLEKLIIQAKDLGLKSVKFLGAGEPLENPRILDFLSFLNAHDIIPVIFSKTGILGDDDAVSSLFADRGIRTGEHLAARLYELGTSIVLGFNSFDRTIQAQMTGDGVEYVEKRNRALEILVRAGFTSGIPTRLALGINPITVSNCDNALDVYKWARLRNMYAIVTPTMMSGRAKDGKWRSLTPSRDKLVRLYTEIYKFNIETNLMTLRQVMDEGVAAYAGGHPCNQVATGLYITLNGVVLSCPGSEANIEGNIWTQGLEDIWVHSSNFRRRGTFNCCCIAKDGASIPAELYAEVMGNLIETVTHGSRN